MIKGRSALQILATINDRLGGATSGVALERYLNDAILRLAEEVEAFSRHELLPLEEGKAEYSLSGPSKRIIRVEYEGKPLEHSSQEELSAINENWRTERGAPIYWFLSGERIRLYPTPDTSGDIAEFTGSPSITFDEGCQVTGNGYWCANDSSQLTHFFIPGDGHCTNEDAANRISVEYAYFPNDVSADTVIPYKFVRTLEELVPYLVLSNSTEAAAQATAALFLTQAQEAMARADLTVGSVAPVYEYRHWEAIQSFLSQGKPLPPQLAKDYEKLAAKFGVKSAESEGFALDREFLQRTVASALADGKSLPKPLLEAYRDGFVHDFSAHFAQLETALPWSFLQAEIQGALNAGRPVPAIIMQAYMSKQKEISTTPAAKSLAGEALW